MYEVTKTMRVNEYSSFKKRRAGNACGARMVNGRAYGRGGSMDFIGLKKRKKKTMDISRINNPWEGMGGRGALLQRVITLHTHTHYTTDGN